MAGDQFNIEFSERNTHSWLDHAKVEMPVNIGYLSITEGFNVAAGVAMSLQ